MPKQISRLLIAFAAFIGLFMLARHFLVPDSFGELGHYRADAIKEINRAEVKYTDPSTCAFCHAEIDSIATANEHKGINCQTCHGPGNKHIEDPSSENIERPVDRAFCGKCHAKNAGRSSEIIRQVDLEEHNTELDCINCHNPHSPLDF